MKNVSFAPIISQSMTEERDGLTTNGPWTRHVPSRVAHEELGEGIKFDFFLSWHNREKEKGNEIPKRWARLVSMPGKFAKSLRQDVSLEEILAEVGAVS